MRTAIVLLAILPVALTECPTAAPPGCRWGGGWDCPEGYAPAVCEAPAGTAPGGCVRLGPGAFCCLDSMPAEE